MRTMNSRFSFAIIGFSPERPRLKVTRFRVQKNKKKKIEIDAFFSIGIGWENVKSKIY